MSDRPCEKTGSGVCPLCSMKIGGCGTVVGVDGEPGLRRRLMEMGLCRGTRVQIVRRSPFGDPIELCVRGYHLSLRNDQAKCVAVAEE